LYLSEVQTIMISVATVALPLVGAIFLGAGVAKAVYSRQFIQHLARYELLPDQAIQPIAISLIGLECALGSALIFHILPQWLVPLAILFLLAWSVLTLWSTTTGRTEDCGCYGAWLSILPKYSILLNLGYLFLLGMGWRYPSANQQPSLWHGLACLLVFAFTSYLAWQSRHQPLLDFARLKLGNRWKHHWLKHSPHELTQGSHFLVFLSQDCPYCKRWVPFLNVMAMQKDLPQVLGILSLADEEREAFQSEQGVRFALVSMNPPLLASMVEAFPTAILVEEGVITGKWVGTLPEEYVNRIKQCYEQVLRQAMAQTA
jgi:thioredoxin-related protein